MSFPLALALVLAVAIPLQLVRARRLSPQFIERWAREHGLTLTPENRPMVTLYLRKARLLRTWGAIAGAVLPSLVEYAVSGRVQVLGFGTDGNSAPLGFGTIFVGYLVGVLYAEISLARPVDGARRSASLQRRELAAYLPRRIVASQRIAAVAGALGTLAIAVVPFADGMSNPGAASLVLAAAGVLASGAGLEAIERWLVRRPQPFTSASLLAADDAIRAQSIHAAAGAGLALLLLYCCGIALGLAGSEVTALHPVMGVAAAVLLVLSVLACPGIGERSWRVRRARAAGTASA